MKATTRSESAWPKILLAHGRFFLGAGEVGGDNRGHGGYVLAG
jgi:hypothetical protein